MRRWLLLILLLWAVPGVAATFYVSPGASGSGCSTTDSSGTNRSTINAGISCLNAGDTLVIHGGTYNENVVINRTGSNWTSGLITIKAAPQETVIVPHLEVQCDPCYVEVQRLIVDCGTGGGETCMHANSSSFYRMRDVESRNGGQGFLTGDNGHDFEMLNFHSHHHGINASGSDICPTQGLCHGFYGNGYNMLIEGGQFHHNGGYGIQFRTGHPDHDITIRGNTFHHNQSGGIIAFTGTYDFYNNVSYNNGVGVWVVGSGGTSKVYQNTVYGNTSGGGGEGGIFVRGDEGNVDIRNNIALNNSSGNIVVQSGASGVTLGNNLTTGSIGFQDPNAGDFRLTAQDNGGQFISGSQYQVDFLNAPRANPPDRGAYEFGGAPPSSFDYGLEVFAPVLTVPQGSQGVNILNASLLQGFPQNVSLGTGALPAGVGVTFAHSTIPFDREGGHDDAWSITSLWVHTSSSTPLGNHTITLTGSGGSVSRQVSFTLTVTAVAGVHVYYVAPTGNNANAGSAPAPWLTIQKALDTVVPGDTVIVRAGTYRERLTVQTSGTAGQPIRLIGEPGAIIYGAQPVTGWTAAGGFPVGVYQKSLASIGFQPGAIAWQGRYEVFIQNNDPDPTPGNDIGTAQELISRPSSHVFWNSVGAIGFADGTNVYLRFRTNSHPDTESFELAPVDVPLIDLNAKDWNIIQGFTLRDGWVGVYLHNGADNNVIQHNTMLGGQYNVLNYNSANNTIRHNHMTLNYYDRDHGHPINTSANGYEVYIYLRKYMGGHNKHGAIVLESADGTIFAYNHVERHFSGMNLLGGSALGEALSNQFQMYNNAIHHVDGYSLEAKNFGDYASVHDNLFYENTENARIDFILGSGSVYYYRNRHGVLTQVTCCCAYNSSCEPSTNDMEIPATTGNLYMYHNSYNGYISIFWYGSVPNSFWVNNIFSPHHCMLSFASPNLHFANSWLGGNDASGAAGYLSPENTVVANGQRMWDAVNPSWVPAPAAQSIGLNLSTSWTVDGITKPALEGMSPGYFTGSAPDAGAPPATVTVGPPPGPPQPPPAGLQVELKADGNNFLDSSGKGHHGTPHNGVTANVTPAIVGTSSFGLDGVDDYIEVAGAIELRPTNFGMSVWRKGAAAPSGEYCNMIRMGNAWSAGIEQTGQAFCWVNYGPTVTAPMGSNVLGTAARLVSCAYNGTTLSLWVDTALVAQSNPAVPLVYSGSENLLLGGGSPVGGLDCPGTFDNFRLTDIAYTQADINNLFAEQTAVDGTSVTHTQFERANMAIGSILATDANLPTQDRTQAVALAVAIQRVGTTISQYFALECSKNGGAYTALTNLFGTLGARIAPDSALNMGDSVPVTLPTGGFTGVAGRVVANTINPGFTTTLATGQQTQWRYTLDFGGPAVSGDTFDCRPVGLDSYANVMRITLADPSVFLGIKGSTLKGFQFR